MPAAVYCLLIQQETHDSTLMPGVPYKPEFACSLAEEVIAAAGSEEAARAAEMSAASAREEAAAAEQQLLACTEMLGEKEERLEELRADLQDVKQLYKDQIEFMVEQLAHLTQKGLVVSPAKSVAEQSSVQQNTDGLEQDVAS